MSRFFACLRVVYDRYSSSLPKGTLTLIHYSQLPHMRLQLHHNVPDPFHFDRIFSTAPI